MWIAFNTKKNYENGNYSIVFDGIIPTTATCQNGKWYQGDKIVDKQTIFYIEVPDESIRYAVFGETDVYAASPQPVHYSYFTPLVND